MGEASRAPGFADDASYSQLGDFELQSGEVLKSARLAYVTRGTWSSAQPNAVLFPTYYTGTHHDNLSLVQAGRALDPARWFVVIPNLFGNGVSSSPSNHGRKAVRIFRASPCWTTCAHSSCYSPNSSASSASSSPSAGW